MPTTAQSPLAPATVQALSRGAALFDAGLFWESHEAWEAAWLVEQGDARVLRQGLTRGGGQDGGRSPPAEPRPPPGWRGDKGRHPGGPPRRQNPPEPPPPLRPDS